MLKLRYLPIVFLPGLVLAQCGGTSPDTDAGTDGATQDAAKDAAVDSGKDAGKDAANDVTVDVTQDVVEDVVQDVALDSPNDAADASIDVPFNDGGTIASISGLVLWLDAAKGVTTSNGTITAWSDQSSQANDASAGTSAPTLVSSSINSLPAAHFVATSAQYLSIADASSLQFGTGDFYIAVVSKFDNDPSKGITVGLGSLYTKLGPSSGLLFFANDLNFSTTTIVAGLSEIEDPTPTEISFAASYNDGTPRLYAIQRASGAESLRVNGSQVATSTSAIDVSESGVEVDIGCMSKSSEAALDGDIAEMVAVKGTLSSNDRANIESYLQSKYGL